MWDGGVLWSKLHDYQRKIVLLDQIVGRAASEVVIRCTIFDLSVLHKIYMCYRLAGSQEFCTKYSPLQTVTVSYDADIDCDSVEYDPSKVIAIRGSELECTFKILNINSIITVDVYRPSY